MKYKLKSQYEKLINIIVAIDGVSYNLKGQEIKVKVPATSKAPSTEKVVLGITAAQIEAIMKSDKNSKLSKYTRFFESSEGSNEVNVFHSLGTSKKTDSVKV